ncbi:MAG: hypothetical protein SF051_08695 [Elusimicrobiota bacterium]|nr:hypothetical protein [Elusimicrobiota bacterium]
MNARLGLLAASLLGLASLAAANTGAAVQAQGALETPRVYDGTPLRPEAGPVFAGDASRRPPVNPEAVALEEQERARARAASATAQPLEPPQPAKPALTSWNPLLNGAKGAVLMGIVGFVLGGPLGMLIGAAVGGAVAWGMTKVGDA